jgi:hypothetical protein
MPGLNMSVKIEGLEEVKRSLMEIGKQAPMVLAKSITSVATITKIRQVGEMEVVFDRPFPYVLNSLYVKKATPSDLKAAVWIREFAGKGTQAEKFLGPQVFGGTRRLKRFERALQAKGVLPAGMYAVPGQGADYDSYGNMKPSQIVQILAYLDAFGETGYRANMNAKGRAKLQKGTKSKRGFEYIVYAPGGKVFPGIYKKTGFAWGSSIKPVIVFVRQPSYKKKFRFFEIGQSVTNTEWRGLVDRHLQDVLNAQK